MSLNSPDAYLNINNANLRVFGNVHTNQVHLGNMTVRPSYGLSTVTDVSNTTPDTIQFTNTHTAFTTTGNVTVGKDLTVSGNVTMTGSGAITLPSGTTAQQPTGVEGMIRFNTTIGRLEYYDGSTWNGIGGISANGGDVVNEDGAYNIHIFENSGTFQVFSPGFVDILMVGGGGAGGGGRHAGGGGAGAVIHLTDVYFTPGDHIITVGAGGGGRAGNVVPTAGTSTTMVKNSTTMYTAISGGYGGIHPSSSIGIQHEYGQNGGCGGGAGHSTTQTATGFQRLGLGLSATPAFGGNGAVGLNRAATGGGGGAGGNGATGTGAESAQTGTGGDGGIGYQTDITGTLLYWAGGGGGSGSPDTYRNNTNAVWRGGDGGNGGGGGGAVGVRSDASSSRGGYGGSGYNSGSDGAFTIVANTCHGGNGGINTGGGGGGAGGWSTNGNGNGGNGGKGIVVIRYLK